MKIQLVRVSGDEDTIVTRAMNLPPDTPHDRDTQRFIKMLMKNRHGTPFEVVNLEFYVELPLFTMAQWHRHRVGWCLAGDTEIWCENIKSNHGRVIRKRPISELWRNWNIGVLDSMGRTRLLPSCRNLSVRNFNENTGEFSTAKITDIFQSGMKEIYELKTKKYSIRASQDHRFLTESGWKPLYEIFKGDRVAINGRRFLRKETSSQIPPALRRGIGVWTSMQRNQLIEPKDNCYICGDKLQRSELELDHVIPVAADLKKALDVDNLKPICAECLKIKNAHDQKYRVLPKQELGREWAEVINTPLPVAEEMTYDISVEAPWHNFMANGFIVHNSYNVASQRYKPAHAETWLPEPGRPIKKIENFNPMKPQFVDCRDATDYARQKITKVFAYAWETYCEMRVCGIADEVARAVLPQSTMTSMYANCNLRSFLHWASLRSEGGHFQSFPQWEIADLCLQMRVMVATVCPYTMDAFQENGLVAP